MSFELFSFQFLSSQRRLSREIINISPFSILREAERARTAFHKVYHLHDVRLEGTKAVQVDNLDYFARAEISTTESDVLKQCSVSVYYPDVNYERESSALRDVLLSRLTTRATKGKHTAAKLPIAIGEGGQCEILWDETTHSILIDVRSLSPIKPYTGAVRLTTTERLKLSKYLDKDKGEKYENAVRVYFNSWAECQAALKNKDRRVARLFPRAFVTGKSDWSGFENVSMTYRAKWFTSPSKKTGVVFLEDARDQMLAKRILIEHNFFAECQEKNDQYNTMILEVNGVLVKRVYLHHSFKGMHDVNEKARVTVYRALIEYLIRNHEWHDPYPLSIYEWKELLNRSLPWHWHLFDKGPQKDDEADSQQAELVFKDVDCGLQVMDLLTTDIRELNFSNGYDPSQRVIFNFSSTVCSRVLIFKLTVVQIVMKPYYCIGVSVTKEVRVACDPFIRKLSEEKPAADELTYSLEIVDKTWTPDYEATDDCDTSEGEISVQGWPREHVEEVAMRLISYFEGTYIDCSNEINGRLLYG
ncbi:hypothetical protein COOONC_27523 [Cooperia oncophora]